MFHLTEFFKLQNESLSDSIYFIKLVYFRLATLCIKVSLCLDIHKHKFNYLSALRDAILIANPLMRLCNIGSFHHRGKVTFPIDQDV